MRDIHVSVESASGPRAQEEAIARRLLRFSVVHLIAPERQEAALRMARRGLVETRWDNGVMEVRRAALIRPAPGGGSAA